MASLIYERLALDSSKKQIRLLRIFPGQEDSRICGNLHVASLHDELDFYALSYAWESSETPEVIQLDGISFTVAQNLYRALLAVRRTYPEITIWIDAICINQSSISERNSQVQSMRDIYISASQVIVWLGEGTQETDNAIAFFKKVARIKRPDTLLDMKLKASRGALSLPKFLAEVGIPDFEMKNVGALLGMSWFRRTWIIQEVVLPSRYPIVQCGSSSIRWDAFFRASQFLMLSIFGMSGVLQDDDPRKHLIHMRSVLDIGVLQHMFRTSKQQGLSAEVGVSLATMVTFTERAQSTDPRDKIYGWHGLLFPKDALAIAVDYKRSTIDVYEEFTRHLISTAKSLNPLTLPFLNHIKLQGLPSWISDFSGQPRMGSYNTLIRLVGDRPIYRVSGDLPPNIEFLTQKVLRAQGIIFDVVTQSIPTYETLSDGVFGRILFRLAKLFEMLFQVGKPCLACTAHSSEATRKHHNYSPQNSSCSKPMSEAIWRLILGDEETDGAGQKLSPATHVSGEVFGAFIRQQCLFDPTLARFAPYFDETRVDWPPEAPRNLSERVNWVLPGRCAWVSSQGWIGLGPEGTQDGDVIVILYGADVPFILRPVNGSYKLIGECFVEGIMYGEVLENFESFSPGKLGLVKEEWIDIY